MAKWVDQLVQGTALEKKTAQQKLKEKSSAHLNLVTMETLNDLLAMVQSEK